MNELKVNLENLTNAERKRLTALLEKAQQPVEKWQPKGGKYVIRGGLKINQSIANNQEMVEFGLYRTTKKEAEKARDAMRTHNRLLAWLAENDDGWVADWTNSSQMKCYVYFNPQHQAWYINYTDCQKSLGIVYMSKPNADKLCKLLNDGVVEL